MADKAKEITTVDSLDDLPGGIIPTQGESHEEAMQGLYDALGSDEEFEDPEDDDSQLDDEDDEEVEDGGEESEDDEEFDEDDDEEVESEEDDEEDEDESEDGDETDDDGEDLHEVTLPGGEKAKVTLDELKAGYSRTEDYTRKRQRDAKEHSDAMADVREVRDQYANRLEKLNEVLTSLGPQKPEAELRKTNPGEYAAQMAEYQEYQDALSQVEGAKAAVQEELTDEQKQAWKAHVDAEWDKLTAAVPEWRESAKATADLAELRQHAISEFGFTEKEIDLVSDHRLLLMLKQNFELTQKRKKAKDKVEGKKAKAKDRLKGGVRKSKSSQKSKRKKQRQAANEQADQSGSVTDAARAIELALADEE